MNNLIQVIKILFNPFKIFLEGISVPVCQELIVPAMNGANLSGVFNRAPVLLSPAPDFSNKSHQTIEVSAIYTIYFFNNIQVLK